jgi:molybdopterin molybdotransferase
MRETEPTREHEPTQHRAADRLSVDEALDRVLRSCSPLSEEQVGISEALGRALASDVRSRVDHPPWNNSAMDGFAVRSDDVAGATEESPVVLPVVDDVPAGGVPRAALSPGTAVRVMTGAPVPEGATGVVRIEHTDGGRDGRVAIRADSDARRNIRLAGEDLQRGATVLQAGTEVTPAVIGSLATMGWPGVTVRRRPRVGVLSNGNELADFDDLEDVLAGRRIMNSNEHGLAALVSESGAEPIRLGIARDETADVRRKIEAAGEIDALITSAGVCVGDHDHVKEALDSLGMEHGFWRVRMRPGGPITFGVLDGRPVFGLPGNPVSAMVTFHVFVRPALRALAGHSRVLRRTLRARAAEDISSPEQLTHFFRVQLEPRADGGYDARLTGPQGSGILSSMVSADALAIVPEGRMIVERGESVEVIPLRDWIA